MSDQNKKKPVENKGGINPVVAGVAGAIIGAGAAAAAIVLSDEEKRKQLGNSLNEVKDKAEELVEDAQKGVQDKKEEIEKKLAQDK